MDKSTLVEKLLKQFSSEQIRDYTFLTFFFLIFSIFIFFAIRPALVTAFSLRKEEEELRKVEALYEQAISIAVANQSILENARDNLYLLSDAFPQGPKITKAVKDIQDEGKKSGLSFERISIGDVNLTQKSGHSLNAMTLNINATSSFESLQRFITGLFNQRRLKNLKSLTVIKQNFTSTQSADLKISLEVDASYQ